MYQGKLVTTRVANAYTVENRMWVIKLPILHFSILKVAGDRICISMHLCK